ncbi:uncharacterized protein B0H18DRAFT_1117301 [Fomitopsis serialis]|uniref:uncharacterized protein n=1 Tax=Fomitopsis serialis TaxID=139415 RepID=UPI002007DDD4|nr:uncharacterized protein B0H18DRAFT_1117301 [Neoantrodia serialis]KAH9929752.1 hypothetical protein B0H18DRAFT_1117301 [Neoantrodia serialis]
MAYRTQPQHDPYSPYPAQAYPDYPSTNTAAFAPDYPPVAPQQQYASPNHGYYQDYDAHSNWETKSTKSYQSSYGASQAHLVQGYPADAIPPLPPLPYQTAQLNYPPMQQMHPGAGWSDVREKLLKQRVVKQAPSFIVPKGMDDIEEMTKLRYTAATCDPDDFMRKKYTLRPYLQNRHTELFIVMTMYNEDEPEPLKMWGPNGWQKVVVCVVSDGRSKINKRTLQVSPSWAATRKVSPKIPSAVHLERRRFGEGEISKSACPVQVIFCLKEQNKKKLNSHRWFFNAFGPLIRPNVCVLLDVGTKPTGTSIYDLWKCFDKHSNVGGACGEICVDTGRFCWSILRSPLAASQNFEYKMSNILDKPLEARASSQLSVLPGAFSAYRYRALQNGPDGKGPLASYFKGETMHGGNSNAGLFERNMYLAEDVSLFRDCDQEARGLDPQICEEAKAATDVPKVPEFISQRRRWLNGSLFATVHSTVFFWRIWTSGQNPIRMLLLQIEFIYNAVQLLFTWTSLANFYLAFYFLVSSATSGNGSEDAFFFLNKGAGVQVFEAFLKLYIALIFVIVVCSLGNRPQGSKWIYAFCMVLFGFCNIITLWCAGYTVWLAVPHTVSGWEDFPKLIENNAAFRDIVVSLAATYGLYFVGSFMHLSRGTCSRPSFSTVPPPELCEHLDDVRMCNLHDVTWGTKGDNGSQGSRWCQEDVDQLWNASRYALSVKPPEQKEHRDAATKQADHDRNSRTNVVLTWIGTNMVMILVFTSSAFSDWVDEHVSQGGDDSTFNPYLTFLFYALAGLSAIRFVCSAIYLIMRLFGF